MAGGERLTPGTRKRLLAVLALVLLLHGLALHWLGRYLQPPSVLRQMAIPMFTRLLQPQAPAAVPVPPAALPPAKPRRPAITALASAKPARRAASQPVPATAGETEVAPASAPSEPAPDLPIETAAQEPASAPQQEAAKPPQESDGKGMAEAASPAEPALDSWPVDTRLNYRLGGQFRGELHGSARVQWQRQGSSYQTRVDIDVTLLANLVMTSQGEVTQQGLQPRAYEEQRRGGPRGVRLGDETITLADGRQLPRPEGVQDTASQFVELSHRFATGQEALEVGRSVSFWMARPGGVDRWTYDIVERQVLQTPQLGAVEAFHLKPRPIANPRGNVTAEMWFAPSLQFLPVRIRVSMGDANYVDLVVEQIEQR